MKREVNKHFLINNKIWKNEEEKNLKKQRCNEEMKLGDIFIKSALVFIKEHGEI